MYYGTYMPTYTTTIKRSQAAKMVQQTKVLAALELTGWKNWSLQAVLTSTCIVWPVDTYTYYTCTHVTGARQFLNYHSEA